MQHLFTHSSPVNSNRILNHFLKSIAGAAEQSVNQTSYSLHGIIRYSVEKNSDSVMTLNLSAANLNISGNHLYKKFDISEYLFPGYVQGKVIFRRYDSEMDTTNFATVLIKPDLRGEVIIPNISMQEISTCIIEINEMRYLESNKELFDQKISMINDYYHAVSILDTALKRLNNFDRTDNNDPLQTLLLIHEINNLVKHLAGRKLLLQPLLEKNDPENFDRRFMALSYRIKLRRMDCLKLLKKTPEETLVISIDSMVQKYTGVFGYYLELPRVSGFYTYDYFQELAAVSYTNSLLLWSKKFITVWLEKRYATFTPGVVFHTLSERIYMAWIRSALKKIDADQFAEALLLLQSAENFCSLSPYIRCSEELFRYFAKARYGLYDSYLYMADKAMETENYELAMQYLGLAHDYQQQNTSYIITNLPVLHAYERIVKLLLNHSLDAYNKGMYGSMLGYLSDARQINNNVLESKYEDTISRMFHEVNLNILSGLQYQTEQHNMSLDSAKALMTHTIRQYTSTDPELISEAFQFYLERNPLMAFYVLEMMKIRGIPSDETAGYQLEVGKRLAKADLDEDRSRDPVQLILRYTSGDSWYRQFNDAYRKYWEVLREHLE